jgi:hypothetical protein
MNLNLLKILFYLILGIVYSMNGLLLKKKIEYDHDQNNLRIPVYCK